MNKEELYLVIFWEKSGISIDKGKALIQDAGYECSLRPASLPKADQIGFIERLYFQSVTNFQKKVDRVGLNDFIVGVVKDKKPDYGLVSTTRGYSYVNKNILSLKKVLRAEAKVSDGVHISDTKEEANHNLFITFSEPYEDLDRAFPTLAFKPFVVEKVDDVFQLLNESMKYVVQRNFHEIDDRSLAIHGDIDLLLEDSQAGALLLNAAPATNDSTRKLYEIKIGHESYQFDLRDCQEGYYDQAWAEKILARRKLSECKRFYIPSDQDLLYMVAYHAIFHKHELKPDYLKYLQDFSRDKTDKALNTWQDILASLSRYLQKNKLTVAIPKDKTVKLNPFNFMASGLSDEKDLTRVDFLPEHHARNFVDLILKSPEVLYQKENRLAVVEVLAGSKMPLNSLALKIVKVKDADYAPYILTEHEKLNLMGSQFTPKVFSSFLEGGKYFLLMERLQGVTLDVAIKNYPSLLLKNKEKISNQLKFIAKALKEKRIRHRDIREKNIVINSKAELKIIDFGLSCSTLDSNAPLPKEVANSGDDEKDMKRLEVLIFNLAVSTPRE